MERLEHIKSLCDTKLSGIKLSDVKSLLQNIKEDISSVEENLEKSQRRQRGLFLVELSRYQPKQRSDGWYEIRKGKISGSEAAEALDQDDYKPRKVYICKKVMGDTFKGNAATQWGQKYEDLAKMYFEKFNEVKVHDVGFVLHPEYPDKFGASPDGVIITADDAYLLEIKCPKSRIPGDDVPKGYKFQIQFQLEVTNLQKCVFLDCQIIEYESFEKFLSSKAYILGINKGILLYDNTEQKHIYPPLYESMEELEAWFVREMGIALNQETINTCTRYTFTFWHLKKVSVITVDRDKQWFEMVKPLYLQTHEQIKKYREEGLPESYKKYMESYNEGDRPAKSTPPLAVIPGMEKLKLV